MHKIIQINLAGQAISIDEMAYEKLNLYLQSVQRHFSNTNSGNEIVDDIEARLAEMFLQKFKSGKTFIDMNDVNETIEIMGSPSDMGFTDEEEESERQTSGTSSKKMFRDGNDKILGGVSSGLAAYFNLDVSLVRLAFIISVLFFGVGVLPYVILWIILPEANTAQDRFRMRGETPDINRIAKKIRTEAENVADNIKKNSSVQRGIHSIGDLIREVFQALGKIAGSFALIGLVVAGVAIVTVFLFTLTGETIELRSSVLTIPQLFESTALTWVFIISLLFVVLLPLASIAYYLICFIFDLPQVRYSTKTVFAVWLISLALLVGSAIYGSHHIQFEEFENFKIERIDSNTI